MASKRDSPAPTDELVAKRRRVDNDDDDDLPMTDITSPPETDESEESSPAEVKYPSTQHFNARCGIQRSIALVASHVGFDSSSPQVMESFTGLVEACMLIIHLYSASP